MSRKCERCGCVAKNESWLRVYRINLRWKMLCRKCARELNVGLRDLGSYLASNSVSHW